MARLTGRRNRKQPPSYSQSNGNARRVNYTRVRSIVHNRTRYAGGFLMLCDKYAKPASDQMQLELPGLSDDGYELMQEARLWAGRHYTEFMWLKNEARRRNKRGQIPSPPFLCDLMRDEFNCKLPNAYRAPLARIAMEQDPSLKFNLKASKVDGFTKAVLNG